MHKFNNNAHTKFVILHDRAIQQLLLVVISSAVNYKVYYGKITWPNWTSLL